MCKHNAFTFAELMISLTIITVIAVLLYPTITELSPNNNKHLFRAAYKTVEMVVEDIIADPTTSNAGGIVRNPGEMPSTAHGACLEFQRRMNAVNDTNGNPGCRSMGNPAEELLTANGMRWAFTLSGTDIVIFVDVNASNNNRNAGANAYQNGAANVWANGSYKGQGTIQDTFRIAISRSGKITPGEAGGGADITREHLLNNNKD